MQKSNTSIKTVVTTTGIPVKNKVCFGIGIFHTAYGLKILRHAENQCAPDVPWGQFWLRHFQNLCDKGAKKQPRQNNVLPKQSRFLGLFRKGRTRFIAKFHMTELVICSHSRERKKPVL